MTDRRRVKQGDTLRRRWRLTQNGGKAIDLTTAVGVEMRAVLAPGQAVTGVDALTGAMGFVDRPAGVVLEPTGGTGALDVALYRVGFWITWGDGSVQKLPDDAGYELLEVLPAP